MRADASKLVTPPALAAQVRVFASNQRQVRSRPAVHPQTYAMGSQGDCILQVTLNCVLAPTFVC